MKLTEESAEGAESEIGKQGGMMDKNWRENPIRSEVCGQEWRRLWASWLMRNQEVEGRVYGTIERNIFVWFVI